MFIKGFLKVSGAQIVPKYLQNLTGAAAQEVFGRPIRRFAKSGRIALQRPKQMEFRGIRKA